jgi:hypothetical protein
MSWFRVIWRSFSRRRHDDFTQALLWDLGLGR